MSKVFLGSDHAGYDLKLAIAAMLLNQGFEVVDVGCNSTDSVDYPDYARDLAARVAASGTRGILVCGTGIGMSIAANKVAGIRAALCRSELEVQMSRNHNNANVLCMGARVLEQDEALGLATTFLNTEFEGGRHARRVAKIEPN